MPKKLYTDRDYLDTKFETLEKLMISVKECTERNTQEITILKKFKDEVVIRAGLMMAILSVVFTLLKDWILEKLGIKS